MPQKRCEVGWMYRAMEKPFSDPKPVPPLSSIPLIGLHPEDSKEHVQKRPFSKLLSTDTPLIRLQKLGGRKDLLCYYKNEPHKDSNEVPLQCVPNSPQDSKLPCSDYQFKVPAYMHHSACILKPPTPSTPKIVDTPCLPLSTTGRPRQRKNKPWNLSPSRLGYSEYNKTVPPLSFIRREYFYPSTSRYIRHNLPSQPDSLADLLTHKYAEEDYRTQKKFWNDYLSQLKDINCCQPRPVKVITSRFSPMPKRC